MITGMAIGMAALTEAASLSAVHTLTYPVGRCGHLHLLSKMNMEMKLKEIGGTLNVARIVGTRKIKGELATEVGINQMLYLCCE